MRGKITDKFAYIEIFAHFFSDIATKWFFLSNFANLNATSKMILSQITIVNYKNILAATHTLSPKMNCLIGHNGVGKTNFLDAIYYLSFCHSAYHSLDSQVITHNQDFFMLEGTYLNENGDKEVIYCGMKRGQKKHFKRNKKEYKRLSEHIGLLPLIFVTPSDSILIEGAAEERRRLMDVVIAQYDSTYIEALNHYNKALQQRNALLKMEEEPDPLLLDIWERQMAEEGTKIYLKRDEFVRNLTPVFQQIYQTVADGREEVGLQYVSHGQRGDLLDVIQRDRFKDRAVGYSLHGVHRDDIEMTLGGYPMRREGSQGQNKTFVIALKLAQFDFLRRTNSQTTPLLLLDDIFDKLDAKRVEQIVNLVASDAFGQIFITDTNRDHLDQILCNSHFDYKLFQVEDGVIKE